MAIIKSGTYVFVEEPTITEVYNQSLNYKAHYLTAENVYATDTYNTIQLSTTVTWGGTITFRAETEHPVTGYVGNANRWQSSPDDSSNFHSTDTTKLRTIIIETDQTVSDNFYTWFTANTTKQITKLSIDLTTLSGWSNLSPGNHTIKIVAKGTGYRDSEKSAGVEVTKPAAAYTDCLTFTGETSEFTLKATNKEWDGTVEYSTDHNTWTVWNGSAVSSVGKKLYLRGSGNTKFDTGNGAQFVLSARVACSGNIQTLLEYSNPPTGILANNCYSHMFKGCTNLTQAPELPATTLANSCYRNMFNGCTSLTKAPELPATTLATGCYGYMFHKCTNLTQAPELPATTLANSCYESIFNGCTSLTKAPELPATTLANYCYTSMFNGCTSLKINTSSGNKIFTCPSTIPSGAVNYMFNNTGGSFTGTPTAGNTYYWTE